MSNLFLIGYRGTGKSTVADLLAQRLGWSPLDADIVLEKRLGKSIREIFADEGETAFRNMEAEVLANICQGERQVVATGGGVILCEQNRLLLRASGRVVWLTAAAETIWRRLQSDETTAERRPNLTVGGLEEITDLLRKREPFYSDCADYTVTTESLAPEKVAEQIHQWLLGQR